MVSIVATLKAKRGQEDKLKEAFLAVMPKVEQEEGTLAYSFLQAQDDPTLFKVYERYKDMDACMAHGITPYLAEMFEVILPLLDTDLEVEMYDEVKAIIK